MLAGCGERFGLDQRTAFTIARGFGAGMGNGGICGAVTGAVMVLGFLVEGAADERAARFRTYDLVAEFMRRFEARRGTTVCKTLLGGVDLGTDEGRKEALERQLFTTVCPTFVREAAAVVEELSRDHEEAR